MATYADELFEIARAITHDESVKAHDVGMAVAEEIGHEFDYNGEIFTSVEYAFGEALKKNGLVADPDVVSEMVEVALADAHLVMIAMLRRSLDAHLGHDTGAIKKKRRKKR
jgi:hypothetical protein